MDIVVENVLCKNGGDEETSYANNSLLQATVISKTRRFLEGTVRDMLSITFPTCFKLADLGCSSAPNTLSVISEILETCHVMCRRTNRKSPEFVVFLNDLPSNDFNAVFKSLSLFHQWLKSEMGDLLAHRFIPGVPGSFYRRLFPSSSLHFFHSSYNVHWLSKVPEGLVNNKRNIYMAKSTSPDVFKAYLEQFKSDFSKFLSLRSQEIMPGGRVFPYIFGQKH